MTPIKQTILDEKNGNCFQAAIASVFDLPLESVPHFLEEAGESASVSEPFNRWLLEKDIVCVKLWMKDWGRTLETYFEPYACYAVVTGTSPRLREDGSNKQHAVVAKTNGWGLKLVHDPHPENTFLNLETPTDRCGPGFWMYLFPTVKDAR